jgi:hypothetical protein
MSQKPSRSPFILIEDFISFNECEDIILNLKHTIPNRDAKNHPIKTLKTNQLAEIRLMDRIDTFLDKAEVYYNFITLNLSPFNFEWMTEGYLGEPPKPDNGMYFNGKWTKSRDIDFTIMIFLSSSKDTSITDTLMESFGGKLEFFNHNLTITPKAGTMLMFPANDNFLNTFTEISLGNLNCIRCHVTAKDPFIYKPTDFPGDYRTWFH